jgi:hypothetical protein
LFGAALAVTVLIGAVIAGAAAELCRRFWIATPWLAPAYGLLGLGLAAHVAWILCWWSRTACVVFSVAAVASSVIVLVVTRFWTTWRSWLPLVTLSVSTLAVAVGHGFWWGWLRDPFLTASVRYGALPGDGLLQYKFAYHLWNNLSTVQFYSDWNGSDRPPLQSGVLLLTRPFETALGVSDDVGFGNLDASYWGLGAGIAAQLLWVPGLYALLRSLRFRPGVAALTIVFVTVLPVVVWNSTFTWPKMMSAGLALGAIAILVTLLLERPANVTGPILVAASLTVLAFLSHGAVAFVVPVPVLLAVLALRRRGVRRFSLTAAAAVVVAGALYLPWLLYGKYADPNHGRLLKWHFAGVIAPDDRKFLPTLVDAYRNASWSDLVNARRANLGRVFDHDLHGRLHPGHGWTAAWRTQDFFSSTFAIGLGTLLFVGWLGYWLLCLARRRPRPRALDVSVLVALSCLACMVVWALVLFLPDGALVHVGTFVWLLVFAAVPFAWAASWSPRLASGILLLQVTYTAVVYRRPNEAFATYAEPHFSLAYAAVFTAGALALMTVVAVLIRADRRPAPTAGASADRIQEAEPVTS